MSAIRSAAIAVAVSLCLSQGAHAGESRPVTRVAPDAPTFDTLGDAARAALDVAMQLSTRVEFGGIIVECGGHYAISNPVSAARAAHVEFDAVVPRDCTLAALYHTHPGESANVSRFSSADVFAARALNVRSFIGIVADSSVRMFDPQTMKAGIDNKRMSDGRTHGGTFVASINAKE